MAKNDGYNLIERGLSSRRATFSGRLQTYCAQVWSGLTGAPYLEEGPSQLVAHAFVPSRLKGVCLCGLIESAPVHGARPAA